ncbi:MAG: two-component regulator propeller domain-containing protein [Bacteroidota bacterium]
MKNSGLLFLLLAFSSLFTTVFSQETGVGEWRDHLPYRKVIALAEADNIIYAATPYSIFYLNTADNSINRLNKINGLSDVGISSIKYHTELKVLVIAYSNANIDLLKDGKIINLSDIKRKPILGNKTINRIVFIGKRAYLACGFGIVVLDIEKEEFPEPIYYIGTEGSAVNVNDIALNPTDSIIYAASDAGIYFADFYESNLANFAEWSHDISSVLPSGPFNHVAVHNNRIYLNKKGPSYSTDAMYVKINGEWTAFEPGNTSNRFSMEVHYNKLVISSNLAVDVYNENGIKDYNIYTYNPGILRPMDAILDDEENIWVGDEYEGLVKVVNVWNSEKMLPNGPDFADVFALSSGKNDVWVVPGGRNSSFGNLFRQARFAGFADNNWVTIDKEVDTIMDDARDILSVAVDPSNTKRAYFGSWGYGLFEFTNGVRTNHYTELNSSLEISTYGGGWIGVGGLTFDGNNNLWATNSSAASVLSVRKSDGVWKSFNLGSVATGVDMGRIIVDGIGQKWMMVRDHALIVFNDNNTIDVTSDDKAKRLTSSAGNGALPGSFILSMASDRDGQVWIGTDAGVAVFYSPGNIFTNQNFDAQRILIEQDGYGQYLLEAEAVTAIAVDWSNRKWFGTDRAGVFLMSADGTEEILHFTEENSPLLSNSITDITISESGEVFFGTAKGIISYNGGSVPAQPTLDKVVVTPNPIKEDYNGKIKITGLVGEVYVKMTDVSGNLIWSSGDKETEFSEGKVEIETESDAQNFLNLSQLQGGVYLIFITNIDGSKTTVKKIMIAK